MKTKTFDCIQMKREAALRVHEQLKDLTVDQQIQFWRQRNKDFKAGPKRFRRPAKSHPTA